MTCRVAGTRRSIRHPTPRLAPKPAESGDALRPISGLQLNLSVDGSVATGSWMEQTSPTGYYRGATYHGTLQLVINPMGREMSGRWVGYGKNFKVNSGEWELTWVDGSTSQRAVRQYHLKV